MSIERRKVPKAKEKGLKDQIAELKEEIRQLQETVGMLVSIVMEEMEEEEGPGPMDAGDEFTFYN